MGNEDFEDIMSSHGLRPTAVRILVMRALTDAGRALSSLEIEDILESVDRSTISRSITAMKSAGLLHTVDDGSGSQRYELCHSSSEDHDNDAHIHFHCRRCGVTLCLSDISVPSVALPEGYAAESYNYVVTGLCPNCRP